MCPSDGTSDWLVALDTVAEAAGDARWAHIYRRGVSLLSQGASLLGESAQFDVRNALMDTSFYYTNPRDASNDEPTGWLGDWTVWGETVASRFEGVEDGLTLDGRVNSALTGFDSRRERWLTGVALSYSEGEGAYRRDDLPGGTVTSRMTNLLPYARFDLNERTNVWVTLGYGVGDLSLIPERSDVPIETGLTNELAAFGGRTRLTKRSDGASMFELALRPDARFTRTTSDTVVHLVGSTGTTGRVRMLLEGSGSIPVFTDGVLSPTLEAALRYDTGDAETGAGLEIGTTLGYSVGSLSLQINARTLLAHEDAAYKEQRVRWHGELSTRSRRQGLVTGDGFTVGCRAERRGRAVVANRRVRSSAKHGRVQCGTQIHGRTRLRVRGAKARCVLVAVHGSRIRSIR